ncbi:hypothetical protein, partial [Pseudomonas aeruginosa]
MHQFDQILLRSTNHPHIDINEQSASGAGTAYAGRASSALDASTIYGN